MDKNIMLIWQNMGGRKLFGSILYQSGYQVVAIQGAESGIRAAVKALPDLILLELDSPNENAMNALTSLTRNPTTHEIPVIAYTESANGAAINASFHAGAAWALTVPFTPREFLKIVGFCLPPALTRYEALCEPTEAGIGLSHRTRELNIVSSV